MFLLRDSIETMSSDSPDLPATGTTPDGQLPVAVEAGSDDSPKGVASKLSASGISTWAKNLKVPQPFSSTQATSDGENSEKSAFAKFTSGLGLRLSPKSPQPDEAIAEGTSTAAQTGFLGTITKGLVDTSKNAVKAVQVKARHAVSQNKRRYQVELISFVSSVLLASSSEIKCFF